MGEKFEPGNEEDLEKIEEKLREEPQTVRVRMNTVPKETSDKFKTWAQKEFDGNYGMLLKYLVDRESLRKDMHRNLAHIEEKIEHIQERIEALEDKNEEEEEGHTKQTLNG